MSEIAQSSSGVILSATTSGGVILSATISERVILSEAKDLGSSPAAAQSLAEVRNRLRAACARFAAMPLPLQYLLIFAAVTLGHLTLLRLPYYWDEGGYYIPAALDFYHHGALIPEFTNAHPPLPSVVLGSIWHVTGYNILSTRLVACAFAAAGLLALFRLTHRLLNPTAAAAVTLLTAIYPIWYAQSSLAHADIFAAAFTLAALALYLPPGATTSKRIWTAILFSLAALSKETAIVWPATLAALELFRLIRTRQRDHARWFAAMCLPVVPLLAWYAYHRAKTGFTFGNPEYLRYNATANFTAPHIFLAVRYRFLHIFTQRNIWLPLLIAAACLFFTRRKAPLSSPLPPTVLTTIAVLVLGNWLFFSILGGALLTRYLLPVYPLLLIVSLAIWQRSTQAWPWFTLLTGTAFVSAWWISPPTSFAPEDCLSYRDMIVVHQQAIAWINQHAPNARVLTAWPASTDLFKPALGYTDQPIQVVQIDDFSAPEIARAAAESARYDIALIFPFHYTQPTLRHWLLRHPTTPRGQEYAKDRDLTPEEIAAKLGGAIVFQMERNGEYAVVLRFPRKNLKRASQLNGLR